MTHIDNPKVAGLAPEWAPFRGFSLLFDSPGDSLRPWGAAALLRCDVAGDPALGFYRALRGALEALGLPELARHYTLCQLPPASYHVTLWDGANDGNLGDVRPERRAEVAALLADLPAGLGAPHPLVALAERSRLRAGADAGVGLRFEEITIRGGSALVAELAPASAGDAARLEALAQARDELTAQARAEWGIGPRGAYRPHVTLGYFASRAGAERARPLTPRWTAAFAERLAGQTLALPGARAYGFSDMATFFAAR